MLSDSTSATSEELGPGALLGKYRVTARLGEGAMGVVYSAMHERLGRPVAIKVLRRELSENTEFCRTASALVGKARSAADFYPSCIQILLAAARIETGPGWVRDDMLGPFSYRRAAAGTTCDRLARGLDPYSMLE